MKKKLLKGLCLFIVLIICATLAEFSYAADKGQELHAFYPSDGVYTSDMERYIDSLDSVSFAWGRLDAADPGSLNTTKGKNGNDGFYYPADYMRPVRYAKSKGKSIQFSIFADGADAERILPSKLNRTKAIKAILGALKLNAANGESISFDGVVVDFEALRDKNSDGKAILFSKQPISYWFNTFLKELNTELDKQNKKLYVAVNPRLYYDGYDYGEIVKIADRMILMAHDYEPSVRLKKDEVMQYMDYSALTPVDGLAPINRVKSALEDVKNRVADSSQLKKVWLQIAFGSAQWQYGAANREAWEALGGSVLSLGKRDRPTLKMIKDRIDNKDGHGTGIAYGYNNEMQSPYIQYFNSSDSTYNVILYEDRNSVTAKMNAAKAWGVGGISLWSLGSIPDYNDAAGKKFNLDVWTGILANIKDPAVVGKSTEKITFTNKKIEDTIRKKLVKPTGDISKSDVESIYRLALPEDVGSLGEIKYLANLEYLDAQHGSLSDIGALGSLVNLRKLYLQRNQIADISPLKKLTKLQFLSLNGNKVVDISALAGLTNLQELYLSENQISSIKPLGSLTRLKCLNLANNRIYGINELKGLKSLETLYLERNMVENISVLSNLTKLRVLSLNGNRVADIRPLGGLTGLTKLYLMENRIKDISPLASLVNLDTLYLGGNTINDFSPAKGYYSKLAEKDFDISKR